MTRDPVFVNNKLYVKGEGIYCKEKIIIEYPAWYEEKGLGSSQEVISFYGIAALIIGDKYGVMRIPTFCLSSPIAVGEVERYGEIYKQLLFGKDDCIVNNKMVVKHTIESYNLFETFFMRAREPWYVEYEDLVKIMDNLVMYAGSNVGGNMIANELVTSFITRSKEDKTKFFRELGGKGSYEFVDLMNVYYSPIGTVNKISGNRMGDSIVSALVQENKGETKLERHMRG